jgi:multiple sugar transport system ATP-binding protein
MVFQNYALYPHKTVRENMCFALRVARRPAAEIDAAVTRAAELLRLTEHLDKKPRHLSGGQKQRVAIGRAITRSPSVFLFDEPLSNLDAALRSQMRVELARLHAQLEATMIYVTHDQTEAMTMADRIIVMRAGVIEQTGAPLELYNRPANRFVAGFLGSPAMNFFPGRLTHAGGHAADVVLDGGATSIRYDFAGHDLPAEGAVSVGVRPEAFVTAQGAACVLSGRVAVAEALGRETFVYVSSGDLRCESPEGGGMTEYWTVHSPSQDSFAKGAEVRFGVGPANTSLFDRDGRTIWMPQDVRLPEDGAPTQPGVTA